jgi:hypothetical protein
MAKRIDSYTKIAFASTYTRANGQPLDDTSVWPSLSAAQDYAKTDKAYVGQILTVSTTSGSNVYVVSNEAGKLVELTNDNTREVLQIFATQQGFGSDRSELEKILNVTEPKHWDDATVTKFYELVGLDPLEEDPDDITSAIGTLYQAWEAGVWQYLLTTNAILIASCLNAAGQPSYTQISAVSASDNALVVANEDGSVAALFVYRETTKGEEIFSPGIYIIDTGEANPVIQAIYIPGINVPNQIKLATELHALLDDTNPHNVTAAQVGALPITGGELTGSLAIKLSEELSANALSNTEDSILVGDTTVKLGLRGSETNPTYNEKPLALVEDLPELPTIEAGDASVTIGGTDLNPTVAVKLSAAEANVLTLADDGLKVILPDQLPSGGTSGQVLKIDNTGKAAWSNDDNTEYTADAGIKLDNNVFVNTGVRSITQDTANGRILTINTGGEETTIIIPDNDTDLNTSHDHSAGIGLIVEGDAGISEETVTYKVNLKNETKATIESVYTQALEADKLYAVQVDKDGKLAVNVPWTDTNTQDGNDNQTVKVGNTAFDKNAEIAIQAGSNNVTIEGDASNKTITISVAESALSKGENKSATAPLAHGATFSVLTTSEVDDHTITDTVTTYTLPEETVLTVNPQVSGSGNAVTGISVDGHEITLTKGATFLTEHQSLADYAKKIELPTVNDGKLTIQKNGETIDTFTANQKDDTTVNILVPTKVSDLINDTGFITDYTDTNTTYDLSAPASKTNGNVTINLASSDGDTDSVTIKGTGATTVTTDDKGVITVHSDNTESELTFTDGTKSTTTNNIINVVSSLANNGNDDHTVTVNYAAVPTKEYVDNLVTNGIAYLGTVSTASDLKTDAEQGDFCRVSTAFDFGTEKAHVGDILIAIIDNPTQDNVGWDLIHTEIDSDTWMANSATADGYVTKGKDSPNMVWKTDENGNPFWRAEKSEIAFVDTKPQVDDTKDNTLYITQDKRELLYKTAGSAIIDISSHTHTVTHTPEGTISDQELTPKGTINTVDITPQGTNETVSIIPTGSVTISTVAPTEEQAATYTPEGSITSTFTGTEIKHSHGFTVTTTTHDHEFIGTEATLAIAFTPNGTVSSTFTGKEVTSDKALDSDMAMVATGDHTHTYTPEGTVSQPTFTGEEVTTNKCSETATTINSITDVGTLPTLTYTPYTITESRPILKGSIKPNTKRQLFIEVGGSGGAVSGGTFSFDPGSLPTFSAISVASAAHTHTVTAKGTVSQPSFSGTEASITENNGAVNVTTASHTHTVTASGEISSVFSGDETNTYTSYTPSGTISSAEVEIAGTIAEEAITPSGNVSSTFTGTGAVFNATFSGTASEHTHTFTGTKDEHSHNFTGTAEAHSHTFVGSSQTIATSDREIK